MLALLSHMFGSPTNDKAWHWLAGLPQPSRGKGQPKPPPMRGEPPRAPATPPVRSRPKWLIATSADAARRSDYFLA